MTGQVDIIREFRSYIIAISPEPPAIVANRAPHGTSASSFPHQSARRVPPIRAQARRARRARIWEGPQARRQRSCRAPARVGITAINLTDPSGFAPSGGFTSGWDTPYVVGAGAFPAAWAGVATYAVIDALGGASAGATAGGAAVATPTTSALSKEFAVVGQNVGKAPGGAASIGLAIGSGIQILDAANLPLPKPAVPARSPTPGRAPTGSAKAQSLGGGGAGAVRDSFKTRGRGSDAKCAIRAGARRRGVPVARGSVGKRSGVRPGSCRLRTDDCNGRQDWKPCAPERRDAQIHDRS